MTEPQPFQTEGSPPRVMLHGRYYSDCSARIRIMLNLKGLDYDYVATDPVKGEGHSPTLLNPSDTIPTLIVQHPQDQDNTLEQPRPVTTQIVTQSVAALEYLEEMYPSRTPLMPPLTQPATRAIVRTLVNIIASDTHPLTTSRVGRRIVEQFRGPEADLAAQTSNRQWGVYWIERGLQAYEKTIVGTAGKYSVGDDITLADACLVPELWTAERVGVDIDKFPTVKRVFERLSEVEAIQRAHWRRQPDTPDELQ
jgi:maleylacetoacetate isomerase